MTRKLLIVSAFSLVFCVSQQAAMAQVQTNGADDPLTQRFTLTVPRNITITCPNINVTMTHDETDTNQTFPTQTWEVKGNTTNGVTVTFQLTGPFDLIGGTGQTHQMRDASLAIAIASTQGPAVWTPGAPTIATDILGGGAAPIYSADSTGVGRAFFDLDMTFVNALGPDGYGSYQAGDYTTTVIGTVSEKP